MNLHSCEELYEASSFEDISKAVFKEISDANESTGEYEYLTDKEARKRFLDVMAQASAGVIILLGALEARRKAEANGKPS